MLVSTVTDALGAPAHDNEMVTPFHCHGVLLENLHVKKHSIIFKK